MMIMLMVTRMLNTRITQSSFLSNFWFPNEPLHQNSRYLLLPVATPTVYQYTLQTWLSITYTTSPF